MTTIGAHPGREVSAGRHAAAFRSLLRGCRGRLAAVSTWRSGQRKQRITAEHRTVESPHRIEYLARDQQAASGGQVDRSGRSAPLIGRVFHDTTG
jgi:hypothetical protein